MARRVLAGECPPRAEHVTSSGWRPQRHPVMTTTGDVLEHGLKNRYIQGVSVRAEMHVHVYF